MIEMPNANPKSFPFEFLNLGETNCGANHIVTGRSTNGIRTVFTSAVTGSRKNITSGRFVLTSLEVRKKSASKTKSPPTTIRNELLIAVFFKVPPYFESFLKASGYKTFFRKQI